MRSNEDTDLRVRTAFARALAPGETVFGEGEPGEHLYVIQSGEVELVRDGGAGSRVVARLGAGDFFGELSLVSGGPRTTRAVAVKRTQVLQLDRETLEGMCLAQPEIAIRMLRVLVSRLIEAERRLAALGVDDLLRPVVRALIRGAKPHGANGSTEFRVAASLRTLAEQAGLTLLEAHRALHQLLDRRLLHVADEGVLIPDLEALSGCLDALD